MLPIIIIFAEYYNNTLLAAINLLTVIHIVVYFIYEISLPIPSAVALRLLIWDCYVGLKSRMRFAIYIELKATVQENKFYTPISSITLKLWLSTG